MFASAQLVPLVFAVTDAVSVGRQRTPSPCAPWPPGRAWSRRCARPPLAACRASAAWSRSCGLSPARSGSTSGPRRSAGEKKTGVRKGGRRHDRLGPVQHTVTRRGSHQLGAARFYSAQLAPTRHGSVPQSAASSHAARLIARLASTREGSVPLGTARLYSGRLATYRDALVALEGRRVGLGLQDSLLPGLVLHVAHLTEDLRAHSESQQHKPATRPSVGEDSNSQQLKSATRACGPRPPTQWSVTILTPCCSPKPEIVCIEFYRVVLHNVTSYRIVPCIVSYCTAPYCIVPCRVSLHSLETRRTVSCRFASCRVVPHRTAFDPLTSISSALSFLYSTKLSSIALSTSR